MKYNNGNPIIGTRKYNNVFSSENPANLKSNSADNKAMKEIKKIKYLLKKLSLFFPLDLKRKEQIIDTNGMYKGNPNLLATVSFLKLFSGQW